MARLHLQRREEEPLEAAHEVRPVLVAPRQRQRLVKGASLQEATEQAWQHGLRLGHRVQAGGQRGDACDAATRMRLICYN